MYFVNRSANQYDKNSKLKFLQKGEKVKPILKVLKFV